MCTQFVCLLSALPLASVITYFTHKHIKATDFLAITLLLGLRKVYIDTSLFIFLLDMLTFEHKESLPESAWPAMMLQKVIGDGGREDRVKKQKGL